MKIYLVSPEEKGHSRYSFNVWHKWGLPGVKCHQCGSTWGIVGLSYPGLYLAQEMDDARYKSKSPVKLSVLNSLSRPLRKVFGANLPLRPGLAFGPLQGSASGKHGDFTWPWAWSPLVSASALDRLRNRGLQTLVAVQTEITPSPGSNFSHLQLHIEPRAHMASDDLPPEVTQPCPGCGRLPLYGTDLACTYDFRLRRRSVPSQSDLFRMHEFPAFIYASERFASITTDMRLTGISFSEVRVES